VLEVVIAQDVRLLLGEPEPAQEARLVVAEVPWYAAAQVRPREVDARDVCVRIPGVADAVAVDVAEVVGLPGICREDDEDATGAKPRRAQDERREPEASTGAQPGEVQTARRTGNRDAQRPVTAVSPSRAQLRA